MSNGSKLTSGSVLLSSSANVSGVLKSSGAATNNIPKYGNGKEFGNYKAPGAYFTNYRPAGGEAMGAINRTRTQLRNTAFRGYMAQAGAPVQSSTNSVAGNQQTNYGVIGSDVICSADIDCKFSATGMPGAVCNVAHQGWNEFTKGFQSNGYCYSNVPIEFKGGKYNRHSMLTTGDGIDQICTSHSQCQSAGKDWFCRGSDEAGVTAENGLPLPPAYNEFGSGNQVGYCAQVQSTATEKGPTNYWIEYGNHSKPTPPPANQNRGGKGYASYDAANNALIPGQSVYKRGDAWFCTYPIKAPFPANLRNQQGSQLTSLASPNQQEVVSSIKLMPINTSDGASTRMGAPGLGFG